MRFGTSTCGSTGSSARAISWRATGQASVHHHGTFPHAAGDIEPTGQHMEVGGLTLYRFENGKIKDIWVYSNVWDAIRSGALA